LMTAPLVTVPEAMSLQGAAHRLAQAGVTGAPVINGDGRCVGVLSATDFVHWVDRGPDHARTACAASPAFWSPWQIVEASELPDEPVKPHMPRDPVTVPPATPVGELARKMIDAHIHRLIVVDGAGKPIGIVSSTDVLAAVARADAARAPVPSAARVREPVAY